MRFVRDPHLTSELLDALVDLWTDVSNAGGAVGFVAPVTAAEVRPFAETKLGAPDDTLIVGLEDDGSVACMVILGDTRHPLMRHWRWVYAVMVHPKHQGKGYGPALLHEAHQVARELGLEALRLTCRGGTGLERFYAKLGYVEAGRVPGGIRVAPGDDRDDIYMYMPLYAM